MALEVITTNTKKWRLDELEEIVDSIYNDICTTGATLEIKHQQDYTNIVLYIVTRSIIAMRSTICLSTFGYEDDAFAIARNLYEQFIILIFFEEHKNDDNFNHYVEDYFTDYEVQRLKGWIYDLEHFENRADELANAKQEKATLEASAHGNTKKGQYWWAGHKSFSNLAHSIIENVLDEEKILFYTLHLCYMRACVGLHSNCMGNMLRLGTEPGFIGVDTSPHEEGHAYPLWFATLTFSHITSVIYNLFNIDFTQYDNKLCELSLFYKDKITPQPSKQQ